MVLRSPIVNGGGGADPAITENGSGPIPGPASAPAQGQGLVGNNSGGFDLATVMTGVADDTSPQLGGNLDLNGYKTTNPTIRDGGNETVLLGDGPSTTGTPYGGLAFGTVNGGYLQVDGKGALVHGEAGNGTLEASGWGSLVHGTARTSGEMTAISEGALVRGSGKDYGTMRASATASTVLGRVYYGTAEASGLASMVLTKGANAYATAGAAFQLGGGTNDIADSLKTGAKGSGPWLLGGGAPGTKENGQIWVANNYVYIRSNGTSVKIT